MTEGPAAPPRPSWRRAHEARGGAPTGGAGPDQEWAAERPRPLAPWTEPVGNRVTSVAAAGDSSGPPLRRERANPRREFYGYRGDPAVCNACPARAACTPGTYGRRVHRSFHAAYLERVRAYHTTAA
jgi:hypothetical protein